MITNGQPGHIDYIKQVNMGAVYRLIDRFGPISRIDLSKRSQLAPASITKIVRELYDAHLVKETQFQEAGSRGRPAIGLVLDTDAWHYVSVRINYGQIVMALRDLSSKILIEEEVALPIYNATPLLSRLVNEIQGFFTRHQSTIERLTAIAVTLPGIVDAQRGVVHHLPIYDVTDMPLGKTLSDATGVPVYVQNDVSAWTMAEYYYGAAYDCQNSVQINIGQHVGAGVIVNGRLLHSGSSSVIEIGHTQIEPEGRRCYCGNNGCLETLINTNSLLERARHQLSYMPDSLLKDRLLTVEALCDAALLGDPLAIEVIDYAGRYIGQTIAIMVNWFHPENIVIGSPLNRAAEILYPIIKSCIESQSIPHYHQNISIVPTTFLNSGTMPGAGLVKEALYNGSLLITLIQG